MRTASLPMRLSRHYWHLAGPGALNTGSSPHLTFSPTPATQGFGTPPLHGGLTSDVSQEAFLGPHPQFSQRGALS